MDRRNLVTWISLVFISVFWNFPENSLAAEKQVIRAAEEIPNSLTPGKVEAAGIQFIGSVYDWLIRVQPGSTDLRPELAESWDSKDGKIWIIKLRQGVKWHDGSDFIAEDAIFSIERTQDPQLGHKLKKQFEIVEKLEKMDSNTIKVILKEPSPRFMSRFTEYNMAIISSKYDYRNLGETKPMGTGPFMVKQIVPKEGGILVKNQNYWKTGQPLASEIHWLWVADAGTRFSMLLGGDIDLCRGINPTEVQRAEKQPNVKVYTAFFGRRIIYMRADKSQFKDPKVRLALKYCLDQNALAKSLRCELDKTMYMSETPLGPMYSEYQKIPPRQKDIAKAKQLLSEAGYPEGFDIDLYYEGNVDWSPDLALVLKEMAAPAGIRINLKGVPRDVYYSQHWLKVDFGITSWAPRVDPVMDMVLAYKTNAVWNESHYSNPELDKLSDQIGIEMDVAKKNELYKQLQNLFYDDGPIFCVWIPRQHGLSSKLNGYIDDFTNIGDFRQATIK
jgi:peptide/nickel transport system substrate-binding protein